MLAALGVIFPLLQQRNFDRVDVRVASCVVDPLTRASVSASKSVTNATNRPSLLIDGVCGSMKLPPSCRPAAARNWQLDDIPEASATDRSNPLVLDLVEDDPVAPQYSCRRLVMFGLYEVLLHGAAPAVSVIFFRAALTRSYTQTSCLALEGMLLT